MSTNYSEFTDKELFDQLEKSGLAEKLMNQPEWKMLEEAGKRIVDRAVTELVLKVKAHEHERIIELQTIIRKYKYGLFDEVRVLKMESDQAFTEAEDRGLIGSFINKLKETGVWK
jgi:hypothetical protein